MSPSGLDTRLLDQDAVRAIVRLQSFGHEAYLVGGCVRDLLLGHRPKDFDIATSARPPAVKRTFPRNSRIIGRRFKLAHLHFDGNRKILEVSTFRRPPEQGEDEGDDEDLLITRDNEFGTAEQDAVRRDFTINALFLDPNRDELIDHVGGLDDIERGMLRTIGDPFVRFREDPVRILRAIKFAGRLGLSIEERTATAMRDVAPDLVRAAPPRVLEEILRLLRGGHAFDAIERMRDCGALRAIMPVVDRFLDSASRDDRLMFWRTLEALDGRARRAARNGNASWPPENGVMLGCVFESVVRAASRRAPERSASTIAEEVIAPFAASFRLPKREAGCVKRICAVQHRFQDAEGDRRWRIESMLDDPFFGAAVELFELTSIAAGRPLEAVDTWRGRPRRGHGPEPIAHETGEREPERAAAGEPSFGDRRKKRRRRGRDRERGPERERAPQGERSPDRERVQERASAPPRERAPDRKPDARAEKARARAERMRERQQRRDEKAELKRKEKVETIEPPALDLSAFDVELDPRRVPTFGTIVEPEKRKAKPRRGPSSQDDSYRPPPPPGSDLPGAPPPPPPEPQDRDSFGDW